MNDLPHINVIYDLQCMGLSDGVVEDYYQDIISQPWTKTDNLTTVRTSNMLVVTRFRVGVAEGDCTINLVYNGKYYSIESNGHVDWWNDVPDYNMDLLVRLSYA